MLSHPWLNMPENYDYKFTKKEYEKIQFKKDMKKEAEPFAEEAKLEMGELVDSEPELYEGDNEGYKPKKSRKDNQFKNLPGNHDLNSQVDPMREDYLFDQLYDSDSDRSLVDAEE